VRELSVPVEYKGRIIGWQRLDMVVDNRVIVELKSTELLSPAAERHLLAYLKVSRFPVGLLLHFGREAKFRRYVLEGRR
jgi:GxxExxY protein